jgi:hypothetical protein
MQPATPPRPEGGLGKWGPAEGFPVFGVNRYRLVLGGPQVWQSGAFAPAVGDYLGLFAAVDPVAL